MPLAHTHEKQCTIYILIYMNEIPIFRLFPKGMVKRNGFFIVKLLLKYHYLMKSEVLARFEKLNSIILGTLVSHCLRGVRLIRIFNSCCSIFPKIWLILFSASECLTHFLKITGELYTWGKGRYGRLGHGDSEDQTRPKLVEALIGFRVIDIACGSGDAQTLCITDDDNVWSWGDGDYGKLGRGGSDGCKIPMKVSIQV